jgi:hypothetical protein
LRLDKISELFPKPAVAKNTVIPGLHFIYLEKAYDRIPDFSYEPPVKAGLSETFDLNVADRLVDFAMKFSGYIEVPANGIYCFSMRSNDGARLYIGDDLVIDNEHLYGVRESCGYVALQAGYHPVTVTFFQQQGGRLLELFWEGPGLSRCPVPGTVLFHD